MRGIGVYTNILYIYTHISYAVKIQHTKTIPWIHIHSRFSWPNSFEPLRKAMRAVTSSETFAWCAKAADFTPGKAGVR